jgi:hypothetical protein
VTEILQAYAFSCVVPVQEERVLVGLVFTCIVLLKLLLHADPWSRREARGLVTLLCNHASQEVELAPACKHCLLIAARWMTCTWSP